MEICAAAVPTCVEYDYSITRMADTVWQIPQATPGAPQPGPKRGLAICSKY